MSPELRPTVDVVRPNDGVVEGRVMYVAGSDPAYAVEVWVRPRTGLRVDRIVYMTPSDRELKYVAKVASDDDQQALPFQHFIKENLQKDEIWLGITWQAPDGRRGFLTGKVIQGMYTGYERSPRGGEPAAE
jgi:hypothetical protein